MPTPFTLTSPLEPADLLFESMSEMSGLSQLGEAQLSCLSAKPDLSPERLLGKPVTVTMTLPQDAKRYLNGYVTRFGIGLHRGRYFGYTMTVRPWLWFLTRTTDCRIFQNASVPEIVKKVFDDHSGVSNADFKLFRQYRRWVYCVQYRESDYNFIARLLEHEGIYWYFEHSNGQHKLVLVDSHSAHDAAPACATLPYYESPAQIVPDTQYISDWSFACGVKTGRAASASFDFERPKTSLFVQNALPRSHDLDDYEVFDYQGDYTETTHGSQAAEDRLTEVQARYLTAHGASNAQGVEVGRLLSMERHPREDQNRTYLIAAMRLNAQVDGYETTDLPSGGFHCEFDAIPAAQQFRPPRQTPKPFVQGPQTAIVVGPAGEDIHTDKYGRVKVQFHWDRYGKHDESSSCWVRVSHPWAGKNFGGISLPRIGQEVVVGFLEGDPDQPLITGRVYNAEQMPPWDLPANATQSGILTRSSKGGSAANANAIRFEDKKGAEQLWIHAEKNQDIEVENDETHWVGHDRQKTVDHDETVNVKHDRTETVGHNETIGIGADRVETVGSNETITIGSNRTEHVGANETIGIGANRTETVGASETITVGSNRTITVGGSETATVALQRTHAVGINETIAIGAAQEVAIGALQSITVGLSQTTSVGVSQTNTIGADQTTKVGANRSVDVGAALSTTVGAGESRRVAEARSTQIGADDTLKITKNLVIEAGESVSIVTGDASILMKKDGTIQIKGKDLSVRGSGKITIKADGDVVVKGSKVGVN